MTADRERVVLHISPHPDDESIGAPATLLLLKDGGHRVVNLACSLGRPEQRARRHTELEEATRRAGFDLLVADPPAEISSTDDLARAEAALTDTLAHILDELRPEIVISPQPHDGHHGHEVVARATRRSLERVCRDATWWMWGIWAELPLPTLYVPFDQRHLDRVLDILDAYRGENVRNDYRGLVHGRAAMTAVVGAERVFGFGTPRISELPYAEVLMEAFYRKHWLLGAPRVFAGGLRPAEPATAGPLDWLLDQPSVPEQWRRLRRRLTVNPARGSSAPADAN